jgi:hypothetical protein
MLAYRFTTPGVQADLDFLPCRPNYKAKEVLHVHESVCIFQFNPEYFRNLIEVIMIHKILFNQLSSWWNYLTNESHLLHGIVS